MRILHVIHSIDPRSGGPSNALRGMVRAQVERGDDVAVLATSIQSAEPWDEPASYRSRMSSEPCFESVDVSIQPAWGRRRPWSRWGYSRACVRELKARLGDPARRPDVVHIHGIFSHLTNAAARLSVRSGIPYVLRPAGGLDPWCLGTRNAAGKGWLLRLLVNDDLRNAAFLHAMSPAEADVMARWRSPQDVHCIPHGVDIPRNLEANGVEFCERFPVARGRRCVLFLGRLHAKKRPEVLVEAFASIHDEFPDGLLVIAGHDDGHAAALRERVRALGLEEHVVFTGFLEGALKSGAFGSSEVFALPSLDENFGMSVIEAMAHGTAPLVTHGVGAHVHVDAAGCGITVDHDAESLTRGLRTLLRGNPRDLGRKGAAYVAQQLSWETVACRLDELYRQAAASAGRRPKAAA